jgi:broad specificity phosphatase PhoE
VTLILARHGQTAANAAGLLLGRADPTLTDLGRRQAAAVAAALGRPARIVSSPLQRAVETAEAFGLPMEIDERWVEVDYGTFDQQPIGGVSVDVWTQWRSDLSYVPAGGESLLAVGLRVREACAALASDAIDGDVVVVSHVSPIKAAVAWALGVGDDISWRMHLNVAAITRIAIGPRGPSLTTFNETAHLAGVDALPLT